MLPKHQPTTPRQVKLALFHRRENCDALPEAVSRLHMILNKAESKPGNPDSESTAPLHSAMGNQERKYKMLTRAEENERRPEDQGSWQSFIIKNKSVYVFTLKYDDGLAKHMSQNPGQLAIGTNLKDPQTREQLHKL